MNKIFGLTIKRISVLAILFILFLQGARSVFAWNGELHVFKDCDKAVADLKVNPDTQVVVTKINGQEVRHLEIPWNGVSQITFTAFIQWDTGEVWSDVKIVNKPEGCFVPSPTPTPTLIPLPSPTLTPTPGPQSKCFDLEAEPSGGSAPLTVKFTAHADDPASGGKIKEYRFDFGDASGGQSQVWFQTDRVAYHRYEIAGSYNASLRIQDQAGNWRESDDCKVTITANSVPQVLSATSPKELPVTGMPVAVGISTLPIGTLGYCLFRRFKLT